MKFKPNPLLILGVIFAASFLGRAATIAYAAGKPAAPASAETPEISPSGHAPADAGEHAAPAAPGPSEPPHTNEEPAKAQATSPAPAFEGEPATLLEAIRERAATLEARERAVAERERLLLAIEARVQEKTEELKTFKADLEKRLAVAESAVSEDVTRLARIYESMKPAKAGEIFNAMDPKFAAGFLSEMSGESAALVLANMQTEKAYAISVIMAGRNAAVNKK